MLPLFTSVHNNDKLTDEISCGNFYKIVLSTPHCYV